MRPFDFRPLAIGCVLNIGILAAGVVSPATGQKRAAGAVSTPVVVPGKKADHTLLFNGWKLTPAGRHIPTGDMLLGGAISPDGRLLAISNCGYNTHALNIVDLTTEKMVAQIKLPRAWNGAAWSGDSKKIFAAGGISGPGNDVHVVALDSDGQWRLAKGFRLKGNDPKNSSVSGLALSVNDEVLYVLNNSDDKLYLLDPVSGKTISSLPIGDHPIACRVSLNHRRLFVANWGGSEVVSVDITVPTLPQVLNRMPTGAHPNDLALSTDDRLYVSCGNADAITVLDLRSLNTLETIRTTLTPKSPFGSTPNSVAVSADNKTVYVANADNNDVCVVDVSSRGHSQVRGFIPTGWYPTGVAALPDNKRIIICSGKGLGTGPNMAIKPIDPDVQSGFQHHARKLSGLISFVDVPDDIQLAAYTHQVVENTPYRDTQLIESASRLRTAVPRKIGDPCPIKYVLYIIKENRTYDQVFGDVTRGNGDPGLCLFGDQVTPNHHALAQQFVLLDNLYCNGEVSADGHPWSTSAIATDFTQRSWVLSYSAKGNTRQTDSVAEPAGGYIWDACALKGLSYRSYGEYTYATSSESAPEQKVEGAKGLIGHGSPKYVGIGWPKGKEMRDTDKAQAYIDEFKDFEKKGEIPRFSVMSLGEDHTSGTWPGAHTPKASVASNDVALGRIVEAISKSSVWKEFAIFVIEDDAQNGPDHVDSHRTAGLVISPYTRRRYVDSTLYTTASMLRTMELILGLPPLTQYDASATPMFASFTLKPDLTPYTLQQARIDLDARNKATAYGAAESMKMDFSAYDRIDEDTLNRILWHAIKGPDKPMPAPVRSALLNASGHVHKVIRKDDDD